jgi:hypothetical protein
VIEVVNIPLGHSPKGRQNISNTAASRRSKPPTRKVVPRPEGREPGGAVI